MFSISVKSNAAAFKRSLGLFQRKQLPFATAGALTSTAFDAQRAVKRNLSRKFNLTNKFTISSVRVKKADKRTLTAKVFFMPIAARYMQRHETGGTKTPRGRSIAVPAGVKKSARGKISKANRPRQILNKPGVFKATIGGQRGIYRRKRGKPLEMLYALEPRVRIRARLDFGKTVAGVVNSRFPRNMRASFARALRTAR